MQGSSATPLGTCHRAWQSGKFEKMAQTSFEVDSATLAAIAELKDRFGVKTNAQVIRKALALARVAAQNADSDNALTIVGPNSQQKKILLAG